MTVEEYFEKNNVVAIKSHYTTICYENVDSIIGRKVWICDYRIKEPTKKPIRSIQPKQVCICSNVDLPPSKRVYRSPIHFREIQEVGLSSAIIAPFDNTGLRESVKIFETQKECIECFIDQCNDSVRILEDARDKFTYKTNKQIREIRGLNATQKRRICNGILELYPIGY